MQESSESEAEKTTAEMIGLGWRLQSLSQSADSLLNSALRLEREIEREGAYWEQIRSVKENGWSVCRVPGDPHTLGVRFGFSEGNICLPVRHRPLSLTDQKLTQNSVTEAWQHYEETQTATSDSTAVPDGKVTKDSGCACSRMESTSRRAIAQRHPTTMVNLCPYY